MKRERFLFLKSLSPMKARIQMTGGQPQSPCVMPSVISTLALVTVIGINKPNLGNPPYYVGGANANDNNQNLKYPKLDARIEHTYVERST